MQNAKCRRQNGKGKKQKATDNRPRQKDKERGKYHIFGLHVPSQQRNNLQMDKVYSHKENSQVKEGEKTRNQRQGRKHPRPDEGRTRQHTTRQDKRRQVGDENKTKVKAMPIQKKTGQGNLL